MSAVNQRLFFLSSAFIIFNFSLLKLEVPTVIEGVVVADAKPATPISRAHVFVIDGEEETLTNDRGEFKITTWQSAPIILTVEHSQYETQRIKISTTTKRQQVVLKKK